MNFIAAPTLWILMLAVGYLFFVYSFLWWAQRARKSSGKQRPSL